MPDLFDHASGIETQFTEMAIACQLQRAASQPQAQSQTNCIECGDEIPQRRREAVAGCKYCTSCQAAQE